jgi:5-methylcytosine-specific restriction enzyme A
MLPPAPTRLDRVIDLLREVGHDVSDWANYAGGQAREATNPKYCYRWCFVQDGMPVVLNLWHQHSKSRNGRATQRHNFLASAREAQKGPWKSRARQMNHAVATAWEERLAVRVILCDGIMRHKNDPELRASAVHAR